MRAATRLCGWALTPVHVGDGTTLTPESYRMRPRGNADVLERFDAAAVIAAMPEAAMRGYVAALRQGGLRQAQEMIQKAADAAIVERIMVSSSARNDIERLVENPQRTGRVAPFVRSGGAPIIPGSSIKGALRTAWLAAEITDTDRSVIAGQARRQQVGKTGAVSNQLQERVFGHSGRHTEQDPMRDLSVSDIALGDEATMIDSVQVLNCTRDGSVGGAQRTQIHVERLLSLADADCAAPGLSLTLALATPDHLADRRRRADRRADGDDRAIPARSPTIEKLRAASNRHHARLWRMERDRFYAGTGTDALMDALLTAFDLASGDAAALEDALNTREAWLLRIGRYSHFEAKSVEGLRFGEKRGKNGRDGQRREARFMETGGSRTAAHDDAGRSLPFGWLLFLPAAAAPATPPRLAAPARTPTRPPAPQAPSQSPANLRITTPLRFAKGDRVTNDDETGVVKEDVPMHAKRMTVDFDGEIDEVSIEGYRRV